MKARQNWPVALTIAGSDSGGGAGIQADLKTFAALGVHGVSAITCLTAQNPRGVFGVQAASAVMVRQQIEAVFDSLRPLAIKTGMLFSASIISEVVRWYRGGKRPPLIVDPVMVATSGARLLQPAALRALRESLFPLATLITPNLAEAELLLGRRLPDEESLRGAARDLHQRHGCAALVKGGHLRGARDAVDILFDGRTEWLLSAPFVRRISTHGTGCTFSAAIAAHLARGCELPEAVAQAKKFITQAIAQSIRAGRHDVLNPFWN